MQLSIIQPADPPLLREELVVQADLVAGGGSAAADGQAGHGTDQGGRELEPLVHTHQLLCTAGQQVQLAVRWKLHSLPCQRNDLYSVRK